MLSRKLEKLTILSEVYREYIAWELLGIVRIFRVSRSSASDTWGNAVNLNLFVKTNFLILRTNAKYFALKNDFQLLYMKLPFYRDVSIDFIDSISIPEFSSSKNLDQK